MYITILNFIQPSGDTHDELNPRLHARNYVCVCVYIYMYILVDFLLNLILSLVTFSPDLKMKQPHLFLANLINCIYFQGKENIRKKDF